MNAIDVLQTVAIISSILLGVWQVRAHTAQIRSSQLQSFMADFNTLNSIGFANPDFFKDLQREYIPEKATSEKSYWFLGYMITIFEHTFIQFNEYGTIKKDFWESQSSLIKFFLDTPYGKGWWYSGKDDLDAIDDEFTLIVNGLVERD